jgi:glycosyltransferase involved in cell wall biosynthesis
MQLPLVSAIMPTKSRPEMARAALESWRAQSWPNTELVIVDDSEDPSFSSSPEGVVYHSIAGVSIGAKRNIACGLATGAYIVHFDSDDISSPERIADQIHTLQDSQKQVTGYHSILFHELRSVSIVTSDGLRATSGYWRWTSQTAEACGTSFCYRKEWWSKHNFADEHLGEDFLFWREAVELGEAITVDGGNMICATNHPGNASKRIVAGDDWVALPSDPRC